jgi:hypothetical protein
MSRNLQNDTRVAIAVVDYEKRKGFRSIGSREVFTAGELYDLAVVARKKPGMRPLMAAVSVKIERIFDLTSGSAGREIL